MYLNISIAYGTVLSVKFASCFSDTNVRRSVSTMANKLHQCNFTFGYDKFLFDPAHSVFGYVIASFAKWPH